MLSSSDKKFIIRGTREGLWFEVVEIGDSDDLISGGKLIALFEIDYSRSENRFKLSKIRFEGKLDKGTKVKILSEVKDFVESLNQP